jgi:hypothetical protein
VVDIIVAAAPADFEMLLPSALVEQFVKPEAEQQVLALTMRAAALQWVETYSGRPLGIFTDLGTDAPGLQIAALLMLRHLFDGGDVDDAPAAARLLIDQQYRTPVMG